MKAQEIIKNLTDDDLHIIGDLLGYIPEVAKTKARRFIAGMCGELKNWEYDETINYGNMEKVVSIIKLINTKTKILI